MVHRTQPNGSEAPVPATALADAYRATIPGTILLRARSYISPFISEVLPGVPSPPARFFRIPYDTRRAFIGAGRPLPDSDTAPTHLVGGTIILGEVLGKIPVIVEHLGIDSGPLVSQKYFGGTEGYGLAMFGPGNLDGSGTSIQDVSVLTTGRESQHSVLIEAQRDATSKGL